MEEYRIFSILDSVDSTNNYAMAQVHAGLAKHGNAWFASSQSAGKGQRGKAWYSNPGENIIMTLTMQPSANFKAEKFLFNAAIAICCIEFLFETTGETFSIKWPNDLYWRDRKAGGILIENILQGQEWKWAVVGVGINVNQVKFVKTLLNPISIKKITGREFDPITLAKALQKYVLIRMQELQDLPPESLMKVYNAVLYKQGNEVQLRKDNMVFTTTINEVDRYGNLLTKDVMDRSFTFGEVEWIHE